MSTGIMAPPASIRCRWSQLREELLDLILARLSLPDTFRFGSICRSWRSIMHARCSLYSPPPLVAARIFRVSTSGERFIYDKVAFMSLWNGKVQRLPMELPIRPFPTGSMASYCLCYSRGWLLVNTRREQTCFLVNLMNTSRIRLPPITAYIYSVYLSTPPTNAECMVLVHGKFSYPQIGEFVASCKLEDEQWAIFDELPQRITSVLFHKGEIYIFSCGNPLGVYALNPHSRQTRLIGVSCEGCELKGTMKLAESGGELLLVGFYYDASCKLKFQVLKFESARWVEIFSLGDQTLLLDHRSAVSFCPRRILGSDFRQNCIYYLRYNQCWIYSMEDGCCHCPEFPLPDWESGWLLPQGW